LWVELVSIEFALLIFAGTTCSLYLNMEINSHTKVCKIHTESVCLSKIGF